MSAEDRKALSMWNIKTMNHNTLFRIIFFMIIISTELYGQVLPYEINTIRYLSNIKSGNDITEQLSNVLLVSNDGDIIVLPKGRFFLSRELLLRDKMVSIIGRGCDENTGTVLLRNPNVENDFQSFFLFSTTKSEKDFLTCISGIYFKSLPSSRYSGGDEVSLLDVCLTYYYTKRFIITDNIFQYFGHSGIIVRHQDSITSFNGLIYNNDFLDIYRPEIANYGYGITVSAHTNSNKKWISNPEFGSTKFLFVEDNFFKETRHAIVGGSNGKYVFRMNTVTDNWAGGAIDMHGAGEYGNKFSTRASEIYGNIISSSFNKYGDLLDSSTSWADYPSYATQIRGGESIIYNNSSTNYRGFSLLLVEESNPSFYPSPYQIGYLSGLQFGSNDSSYIEGRGDGDVFIWNNDYNQKFPIWSKYVIPIEDTFYLKFNRDIHVDVEKPSYSPYVYPHDYRYLFYSFIDTFLNQISILNCKKVSDNAIQLTWKNVLCEDGYYIHKSTDGSNYTTIDSTAMNDTTVLVDNLVSENYWFKISAYNDHHNGRNSVPLRIGPDLSSLQDIIVYPNPSNGNINIQVINTNEKLSISDIEICISSIDGRSLYKENEKIPENGFIELSMPDRSKGFYLISVKVGETKHNKIIAIL